MNLFSKTTPSPGGSIFVSILYLAIANPLIATLFGLEEFYYPHNILRAVEIILSLYLLLLYKDHLPFVASLLFFYFVVTVYIWGIYQGLFIFIVGVWSFSSYVYIFLNEKLYMLNEHSRKNLINVSIGVLVILGFSLLIYDFNALLYTSKRLGQFMINPNYLGMFFVALYLFIFSYIDRTDDNFNFKFALIFFLVCVFVFFTKSRSATLVFLFVNIFIMINFNIAYKVIRSFFLVVLVVLVFFERGGMSVSDQLGSGSRIGMSVDQMLSYNDSLFMKHDTSEYDTSEYDSSEYDSSEYDSSEYDSSEYDSSEWLEQHNNNLSNHLTFPRYMRFIIGRGFGVATNAMNNFKRNIDFGLKLPLFSTADNTFISTIYNGGIVLLIIVFVVLLRHVFSLSTLCNKPVISLLVLMCIGFLLFYSSPIHEMYSVFAIFLVSLRRLGYVLKNECSV